MKWDLITSFLYPRWLKLFLFKDKLIFINTFLSLFLNLIIWLILYWQIRRLIPQTETVVLRYNIYFGINLLGPWHKIFFFPLVGLFLFLVNFILAYLIYFREKMAGYFLIIASSLIQILLLFSSLVLIFVNLS